MKLSMISLKSFCLSLILVAAGLGASAQKQLDKVNDLIEKKKYADARTEIDNFLANEKNASNSNGWYAKAKVYSLIAMDSSIANTVPNAKDIALDAAAKHMQMENQVKDSAKRFVQLTLDNRKPLTDLYAGYSKEAASYYNAGNYNDALKGFQGSLKIFDLLANQGWTSGIKLDTISVLYAGISAEKANKLDTAAFYYGKIAEAKAKQQGFESIYKWLADYYKNKGDIDQAGKYTALGKEVYPDDPFWTGFEVSMLSEKGSKEQLFAKYEDLIKTNPTNAIYHYNYAVELYKAAYNEDTTQRPANAKEMTEKAVQMAEKSVELDPNYPNSRMLLGQIYYNQAVDILNENKAIRPKGNVKLTAAQLKQKEDLRQAASKKWDEAIVHFEKIDQLLGKQGKLKMEEKQFLKDSYDLLINIYDQKQNQEKSAEYNEKFVNVDKIH